MKIGKRLVIALAALLLVLTAGLPQQRAGAAAAISLYLDGVKLESDVPPYILPRVNVTLVPLRVISEGIGAEIAWSQASRTVTIGLGGTALSLTSGAGSALVNGAVVPLDASVQNREGRIMVPLRFVGEALGMNVGWNQTTKTITLQSSVGVQPGTEQPAAEVGQSETLRGAWVSTVYNLDWPSAASYRNSAQQKLEYAAMLDELQAMGMNAVFVQVRPAADSLYPSAFVPWSAFLTGVQGGTPDYDPLAFMVEETHKRGMQFHAWFNPFRAGLETSTAKLAANHVALQHPDWIVNAGGKPYINPGIPDARQMIIDTIMEVVDNYDIDGVHLDDYFYPSGGAFNDEAAFAAYNKAGIKDRGDWRRDNINEFVKLLDATIHAAKPDVRFGISPFGVWRNKSDDPSGSDTKASVTDYDDMYADVRTWIREGWVDYVAPQIYWSMSFSAARYDKLADWWASEVSGTGVDLYIGHSPYKLGTKEAGWQSAQELVSQLRYNELHPEIDGDLFFSAKDLRRNPLGVIEALRGYFAAHP